MTGRLIGKVALVSGGARGMGASHVRAIVREGGQVVLGDILDDEGQKLAAELGSDVEFVHLDVTDADQWERAVKVAVERFGKLNVLVNNAGIATLGSLAEYTREQLDLCMAINLTGPFLGMAAAADALKAAAPASIINISSGSAFFGKARSHGYTASKWALRGLTKSVAMELAAYQVRVNSVHPGYIDTPLIAGLTIGDAQLGPLGRLGTPEEVSNLIVFLASDESSFSTGSEFIIDGGGLAGPMTK